MLTADERKTIWRAKNAYRYTTYLLIGSMALAIIIWAYLFITHAHIGSNDNIGQFLLFISVFAPLINYVVWERMRRTVPPLLKILEKHG